MVEHDRKAKTCVVGSASLETAFDLTAAMCATAVAEASRRRARGTLVVIAWSMMALVTGHEALAQERCLPVSERTGEVGCWIMTSEPLGQLSESAVFWHLDTYPNRAAAEAQKGPRGTVIEALGRVWLFTIGAAGWRPAGGVRVAEIGPLLVKPGEEYTAGYLEAIFSPGMTTIVHRHPGPEAFYTTAGEVCLETPDGKIVGGAGASTIVPAGRPMQLTATGTEQRRSVALILFPTSQSAGDPAHDWTPKGVCKQ